jgi:signal transduction histidine kinase
MVVDQPDLPLMLDADATRIAQVLSNLLNNAAKYTPLGGRIDVTIRRDGGDGGDGGNGGDSGHAVVTVADNGIGIPVESLSNIFLMFNQVGHNMHRSQGGLGVGLSLVKRLVEMHGGSVVAHSEGSGAGSRFTVRLPLADGA